MPLFAAGLVSEQSIRQCHSEWSVLIGSGRRQRRPRSRKHHPQVVGCIPPYPSRIQRRLRQD